MNKVEKHRYSVLMSGKLCLVFLLSFLPFSCQQKKETKKEQYTCPMHTEIIRDKPGPCPICGMDLVKITAPENVSENADLTTLEERTDQAVVSKIKTIAPIYGSKKIEISANGKIDYDTRTYQNIAARFSGRIEKLYVKYTFQRIEKGEKILELYSPEIATAAQDYLFVLHNSPAEKNLLEAAKQKLTLLGMTPDQINSIEQTKKAKNTVTIYSPYKGHIHVMAPGKEAMAITDTKQQEAGSSEPLLKEGSYVEKGQILLNVVDPQVVWAVLKIYADDIPLLHTNQDAVLYIEGDTTHPVKAKVDFVQAYYEGASKGLNVRVYLNNSHHAYKVGMLVTAKITSSPVTGLWIPRQAVLHTGQEAVVLLQKGTRFEAHKIQEGQVKDGWIEVKKGLSKTDRIAFNARYMMDSESLIKVKNNEN